MSTTVDRFIEDLEARIEYFRAEYDLTYSEAIGCLEIIKHELLEEMREDDD